MGTLVKKTIQVYLEAQQLASLRALAEQRQVSIAALMRESVDLLLAQIPVEEDPLMAIVALGDAGESDLAERHDDYLAEGYDQ